MLQRSIRCSGDRVRLAAHISLLAASLYLVVLYNVVHGSTQRQIGQNFHTVFLPDDANRFSGDDTDSPAGKRVFIFSRADVRSTVELMLQRYWDLNLYALAPVEVAVAQQQDVPTDHAAGSSERGHSQPLGVMWSALRHAFVPWMDTADAVASASDDPLALPTVAYTYLSDNVDALFDAGARGVGVATSTVTHDLTGPSDLYPFSNASGALRSPRRGSAGRRRSQVQRAAVISRRRAAAAAATSEVPTTDPDVDADDDLFRSLVSLKYTLPFRVRDPAVAAAAAGCGAAAAAADASRGGLSLMPCGEWLMRLVYDFSSRGQVEVLWAAELVRRCSGDRIAPRISESCASVGVDGADLAPLAAACAVALLLLIVVEVHTATVAARVLLRFARAVAHQHRRDGSDANIPRSPSSRPLLKRHEGASAAAGSETTRSVASTAGGANSALSAPPPLKLAWWHVLSLIDPWIAATTVADALLATHCITVLAAGVDVAAAGRGASLAAASFLLWLTSLQYARANRRLYSSVLTLGEAAPQIAGLLIAPAPIFIAFALFALVIFGNL